MYKIDIDDRRQILSITLSGLLDDAEARRYVDALQSEFVRRIGARPYVMMVDTRQMALQPQSVVTLLSERIAAFPKATRIAMVNGPSLARMQLKRMLSRDYLRYFDTVEDARSWLLNRWPEMASVEGRGGSGQGRCAGAG